MITNAKGPCDKTCSKIKVLHAVEDLKIGGMERVIAGIVTGLNSTIFSSHVLCISNGGTVAEELTAQGIPVSILGLNNYHYPDQLWSLRHWLKKGDFHLLHTHGYFAGAFGRVAGLMAGVPCMIHHVHSTYHGYGHRHLLMERIISLRTDKIICISQAVQQWVVANENIPENKTVLIYNGVSSHYGDRPKPDERVIIRKELGIPTEGVVFLVVASLVKNKGHDVLFRAFAAVHDVHKDATILVVGDGPERGYLERCSAALNLGNKIIFTGLQSEVISFLMAADVVVLPSIEREGLGIALIEAMAVGLPVIGSDLGGIREVIENGLNGLLVPPGDQNALAQAIIWMIEHPEERRAMGLKGKEKWAKEFTTAGMIEKLSRLYEETISRSRIAKSTS